MDTNKNLEVNDDEVIRLYNNRLLKISIQSLFRKN